MSKICTECGNVAHSKEQLEAISKKTKSDDIGAFVFNVIRLLAFQFTTKSYTTLDFFKYVEIGLLVIFPFASNSMQAYMETESEEGKTITQNLCNLAFGVNFLAATASSTTLVVIAIVEMISQF